MGHAEYAASRSASTYAPREPLVKVDPYSTRIPDEQYRAAFVKLEKGTVYGSRR